MRIVLNADDFGYSADTARATIECFEGGYLTSATIMTGMPATGAAVEYARQHPELSFGLHLALVGDGAERPLSPPGDVPALVDGGGHLRRTNALRLRALAGALPVDQVARELEAQLSDLRERGVAVSHVDSHRHLHKFAPVREALRRVLPRFGIRRVRNVQDLYLRKPLVSPTFWLGRRWRERLTADFATTDHFYMPASAGDREWGELVPRLDALPSDRTLEIGVHPGFEDDWRADERTGLISFAEQARARGHSFVGWSEIGVR
jgi:predicted glycoside hydrolase/deacetylase ChbG (UPF0249 family)